MSKVQLNIEIDVMLLESLDNYAEANGASRNDALIAIVKSFLYGDEFINKVFQDLKAEDDAEYAAELAARRRQENQSKQ